MSGLPHDKTCPCFKRKKRTTFCKVNGSCNEYPTWKKAHDERQAIIRAEKEKDRTAIEHSIMIENIILKKCSNGQ